MPFSGYTSFGGQTVGSQSVLIRYTRNGDTDLNGLVDDTDVAAIITYYKDGISAHGQWAYGDMDYDNQVDDDDVVALATFYNQTVPPLAQCFSSQPIAFSSSPAEAITQDRFPDAPSVLVR